jgi:single-strand DNA-binding protein
MNKAILMGRLTRDPEVRYSQSAEPVAIVRFDLAINRRFKKDEVDFINCVAFGKTGQFIETYFKKGAMIAIEGNIHTSNWDDKDSGQKRYKTEVIVNQAHFTGSKSGNGSNYPPDENYSDLSNNQPETQINDDDNDLPF